MATKKANKDLATEAASQALADLEIAEAMLVKAADEGRQPNHGEVTFCKSKLNWSDREIERRFRQMPRIARDKAIAGRPEDLDAAEKHAVDLVKVAANVRQENEPKIRELQAAITAAEREAGQSRKRVDEMVAARDRLRDHAPQEVRAEYNNRKQHLNRTLRRRLLDVENELNEAEMFLQGDVNSEQFRSAINTKFKRKFAVREEAPADVRRRGQVPMTRNRFDAQAWHKFRDAEIKPKVEPLRRELAKLEAEYEEAMDEIESLLDYRLNES